MKKTVWTRILSIILAITLTVALLPILGMAAEIVDSGQFGNNLVWALDDSGVLAVEGLGAIPQNAFRGMVIKAIEISEGVTSIGASAFYNCTGITIAIKPS